MAITNCGQIGAGKVVPFIRPSEKPEIIAVPIEIAHLKPMKFQVCGDSFIDEGIQDGTIMVARRVFQRHEITPGRLCIVRVAGSDDAMKRVYLERGLVRLHSANPNHPDKTYALEFVEIVALVEGEWKPRK